MKKYFTAIFLGLILLVRILSSEESVRVMKNILNSSQAEDNKAVIVIDPGHGGRDPGKVGVNKALEKDINLVIALKLSALLEADDFNVIMTREEDIGLYSETDSNKKRADLNRRVDIINSSEPLIAVSIHQNSFVEEYVKGAQVFYYSESPEGRKIAETIQMQLKEALQDGNNRKAKANTNYYMLKKTTCPLVIVECGYLSNYNEAKLLLDASYQEKLAKGIYLGITKYIDSIR